MLQFRPTFDVTDASAHLLLRFCQVFWRKKLKMITMGWVLDVVVDDVAVVVVAADVIVVSGLQDLKVARERLTFCKRRSSWLG